MKIARCNSSCLRMSTSYCKLLISLVAWPDSNLQPDRSIRLTVSFVDFAAFSFQFTRVRFALTTSFLVRNWCGSATPQ